jgi:Arabinose-binding domain of AraC transcription regulator, N-term
MRHHAETSTTTVADLMLADLRLSHQTLVQQFDRVFVEIWYKVRGGSCFVVCCHWFALTCHVQGFVPMRISAGEAAKLAWRSSKGRHFGSQPDALGVATRLAAGRLREAGIVLEPLLRRAGLSLSQINKKDVRIGVASQIMFLELAAQALKDPLLGFRLARDGDLRQMGMLLRCSLVGDARGGARSGPALQFDRQCRRRFELLPSRKFHNCLALLWRRQAFRSATDGIVGDPAYPRL